MPRAAVDVRGPEGVGEGKGLSLTGSRSTGQRLPSAGADWTAVLHMASPWGGGAVHTLSRLCPMRFSLLTQTQVTVSMLVEQEVCFSGPMDGANVIACVSRLMSGSLVCLGSRPILWLSSTIGYREREQEGW